ncbi:proline iminopeptidase-family hydrolase [Leptobacterium flavescens]|uniref:Proline iminopeptidase-family hydrolase n=1 Tax=Leptobacterium flavescens TaxID=472055 RepID=A0A6P0UUJ1_9FLAO|nr:proline iminopeptidase-family hydrolase [Leptobacterium flavescens]NER14483.1 proline iminopeptidase-family hydrolase [Leptobacterium flavescens]
MRILLLSLFACLLFTGCKQQEKQTPENISETTTSYLDYSGSEDQFTGGIRMIPITTPKGTFKVWTKRVGNNPTKKVLLLHGGPGATHELYECFDGYLPNEGIEYIYYDQLGSYYSDKPEEGDTSLWTIEHFVDEVEQVRKALGLNKDNFYLLGQSWGGILAMEYAFKYQDNIKGLIISNMMSSIPEYNQYAKEVLGPQMDPEVLKEIMELEANEDFANPRYNELLFKHHYTEHVLRMPIEEWPESITRCFNHLNPSVYVFMQGHSEFGISGDASLKEWDVKDQLKNISVPTLVIGAKYDTMDPAHMEWMSKEVQNGRYLFCPNGSHLAQYDDQKVFFSGLVDFINDVDDDSF